MSNINGINTDIIEDVAKDFKKDPEKGVTEFSSSVTWQNGFNTEAQVKGHKPVISDEPEWLAGSNKGPNPVELLLSSLGSCVTVGFIATASTMGIKVDSLEVKTSGQVDLNVFLGLKEGNPGFNEVNVQFFVNTEANDEQLKELVSKALELSPVENSMERNVQIHSTFERLD